MRNRRQNDPTYEGDLVVFWLAIFLLLCIAVVGLTVVLAIRMAFA